MSVMLSKAAKRRLRMEISSTVGTHSAISLKPTTFTSRTEICRGAWVAMAAVVADDARVMVGDGG